MANGLNEKDLQNLDKQTLITMLKMSNASNQSLQQAVDQLQKSVSLLTEEVLALRQNRFGRSSEKKVNEIDGQLSFVLNEAEGTIDIVQNPKEPEMEEVIQPASKWSSIM